jgi:hypothetical protein
MLTKRWYGPSDAKLNLKPSQTMAGKAKSKNSQTGRENSSIY